MNKGDLIMARNRWHLQDKVGIILSTHEPPRSARFGPGIKLYWVFCDGAILCFSGNQLKVV